MPAIKIGGRDHPFGSAVKFPTVKLPGYKDCENHRCQGSLRRSGSCARIARIAIESSQLLGQHGWVVERAVVCELTFKRLALRYDRMSKMISEVTRLAVALIADRLRLNE